MITRKKHVTLTDVAREVGVSRALVGKVLGSCSGNIRVSAETARIIREAAQRLHYQPNLSARALTGIIVRHADHAVNVVLHEI